MIAVVEATTTQLERALQVQVLHKHAAESAIFDDDHLVSLAGLVPAMTLADQTQLPHLLAQKVSITTPRIASGSANPGPKLATLIAGMCAGADSIDDIDLVRSGGMRTLFGGVYAPSTIGTLLREFTFGHARQLESVLREHLAALCARVDLLPGAGQRVFVDIDSLLRPVYGHAKQGASYGHTKIAGKQVLRNGLSPIGNAGERGQFFAAQPAGPAPASRRDTDRLGGHTVAPAAHRPAELPRFHASILDEYGPVVLVLAVLRQPDDWLCPGRARRLEP